MMALPMKAGEAKVVLPLVPEGISLFSMEWHGSGFYQHAPSPDRLLARRTSQPSFLPLSALPIPVRRPRYDIEYISM
jgi:hypothetical protein